MGRDGSMVVVDYIALASAGLEKVEGGVRRSPERQTGHLKGQVVMARWRRAEIPHRRWTWLLFAKQHCRRLRSGDRQTAPELRHPRDRERGPPVVQFLPTCLVRPDFAFGLQFFPTHSRNPQW